MSNTLRNRVLHIGLTDLAPQQETFELEGAQIARDFSLANNLATSKADLVHEMVALHNSVGVAHKHEPEVALLQQVSVMVVDDSSIARKLISELLDRFGISYQTFESADEALSVLRERSASRSAFHVLVSDIEMLKMDGYELVFAVNDDPNTRALYTILHTSLSSEMSQERAKQVGANEALSKFNARDLMNALLRGAKESAGLLSTLKDPLK